MFSLNVRVWALCKAPTGSPAAENFHLTLSPIGQRLDRRDPYFLRLALREISAHCEARRIQGENRGPCREWPQPRRLGGIRGGPEVEALDPAWAKRSDEGPEGSRVVPLNLNNSQHAGGRAR